MEAWRTGAKGSLGWKMGASGLENWPLGVQNDAWDLQIGAKMGPGRPKSGLGGSHDLVEGGLESSELIWMAILEDQGPVWTPSWGHLGATGGVSGTILEDLELRSGSGKAIFWIRSGKVQNNKIVIFPPVC